MSQRRPDRDPTRPVYVISVAASIVSVHPRTLRIYEDEGLDRQEQAAHATKAGSGV